MQHFAPRQANLMGGVPNKDIYKHMENLVSASMTGFQGFTRDGAGITLLLAK